MRIAVTSQNFRTVTEHAGRARRFLVFEGEPGGEPNPGDRLEIPRELTIHEWPGGPSHPLDGFDVVITGGAGSGFVRKMAERGIEVAITTQQEPLVAACDYLAGRLRPTSPAAAELHVIGGLRRNHS